MAPPFRIPQKLPGQRREARARVSGLRGREKQGGILIDCSPHWQHVRQYNYVEGKHKAPHGPRCQGAPHLLSVKGVMKCICVSRAQPASMASAEGVIRSTSRSVAARRQPGAEQQRDRAASMATKEEPGQVRTGASGKR